MAKPIIFLSFLGDARKGDLKLHCAAVNQSHMKKAVVRAIHEGRMVYGDGHAVAGTITQQIRQFRKDWKELPMCLINEKLHHGYLDTVYSGEVYAQRGKRDYEKK
jgi:hypothetical protein